MKKSKHAIIILLILLSFCWIVPERAQTNTKFHFVIIFPGGPSTGGPGNKMIRQFIDVLSKKTGISSAQMSGAYFNRISTADRYLQRNRNAFIMGSVGYYVSRKNRFNLEPLAALQVSGSQFEKYYIMTKKGRYASLQSLRGKVLSGNVLYEDARFIDKIIFENKIVSRNHFTLKPTSRPLRALRKVKQGKIDAVILNRMQYVSLKQFSWFKKLHVTYTSKAIPALGLMMRNTPTTNKVKNKILQSVTTMCNLSQGKKVCKSFGISGFKKTYAYRFSYLIRKYGK